MILKKIDFLSPEITLFHKGSLSHSSIISGILSIITCFIIILCSVYYSLAIIDRQKDCPKIAFYTHFIEDAGIFPLNSSSFFHFISIIKDNHHPEREEFDFESFNLIGLETYIIEYENDNDLSKYNHWLYGFCNKEKDTEGITNLVTQNFFTKSACIRKYYDSNSQKYYDTDDPNFRWPRIAHGTFNQKSEFYSLILQKCNQNILNNIFGNEYKCKNDTEIEEMFKYGGVIHFNFIDHLIDTTNYTEPIKKYFYRIENTLDEDNYSINFLNFNPIYVRTQKGIIFDVYEDQLSYSYERNDVFMRLNKANIYMGYLLCLNNKKNYYERIYKKISDILSEIGGVTHSIIIIASFINRFINQYIALRDIKSILNSSNTNIEEVKNVKNNNIDLKKSKSINLNSNSRNIELSSIKHSIDKEKIDISSRTNLEMVNISAIDKKEINEKNINKTDNNSKNKIIEKDENNKKTKLNNNSNEKITFWNFFIYKLSLGRKYSNLKIYENFREKMISEESLISNNLNVNNLLSIKFKNEVE